MMIEAFCTNFNAILQCPRGYEGPRCQQTTRSFWGKGWAWYPPLELCDESHLSIEFLTRRDSPNGVLLYNGPIVPPEPEERLISDFISLELVHGNPRYGEDTCNLLHDLLFPITSCRAIFL